MSEAANLSTWMERVSRCNKRREVFAVLDEFRKEDWTDEECSQMAKHYIRLVTNMADDSADAATAKPDEAAGNEADGPVWYEKM